MHNVVGYMSYECCIELNTTYMHFEYWCKEHWFFLTFFFALKKNFFYCSLWYIVCALCRNMYVCTAVPNLYCIYLYVCKQSNNKKKTISLSFILIYLERIILCKSMVIYRMKENVHERKCLWNIACIYKQVNWWRYKELIKTHISLSGHLIIIFIINSYANKFFFHFFKFTFFFIFMETNFCCR